MQNGHPEKLFSETLHKQLSLASIEGACDQRWNNKSKTIRLFWIEGL